VKHGGKVEKKKKTNYGGKVEKKYTNCFIIF
jgi:hypothetical protein